MFKVEAYRRRSGKCPFDSFIDEIKSSGKEGTAKIQSSIDKLRESGFDLLGIGLLKKIEDDIYELRPGPYRVFVYWSDVQQAFLLLNAFRRKTAKLPRAELEKARRLRSEVLDEVRWSRTNQ